MEINFADGTSIEVAASALNDFVQNDLEWVEFVHGRVANKKLSIPKSVPKPANQITASVSRCGNTRCGAGC
ncbi:MAG TPA: hypothetical protein VFL42_07030 [Terriglobales bacterium]|jgi:hypothetical protein|nr:hypothetical protein [Terriglobales bacterium]